MLNDPLKLVPLGICVVAAVGLFTKSMSLTDVLGLLIAAGIVHPAISTFNNVNPK